MVTQSLALFFTSLILCSCGFSIKAAKNNQQLEDDSQNYDNVFCISKDYEICDYFKRQYSQSTSVKFDGIIEIVVNDVRSFYSNWDSSGSPRISKTIVTIEYFIIKNKQANKLDKSIISGLITSDTPYQFGLSVIGDLYIQRHAKQDIVNEVIHVIQHSTESVN